MKTILFSIQVYWSSHFILPKAVIKNIEQLLRSFLWKGDDVSKGVRWLGIFCVFLEKREALG